MKKSFIILILFILTSISATIINVPADQPTIQAGINESVDADTILVQPGTYVENINYNGKNITVASLFFTTQDTVYISQTIIDGNNDTSVATFESGEDQALLSGFTITNGYGEGLPFLEVLMDPEEAIEFVKGGGIHCYYSGPTLSNLVINNNTARNVGGGIGIVSSNPIIENVKIINNSVLDVDAIGGGGIAISSGDPIINNCEIANNNVGGNQLNLTMGGGIFTLPYIGDATSLSISNSAVMGNTAVYGGGLGFFEGAFNMERILIFDNTADIGSAICLGDPSGMINNPDTLSATIVSSTIVNNLGNDGILGESDCIINIINSILWENGTSEVNIVSGDVNVSFSDVLGGWTGEGNIDSDPLFVDSINADYHLTGISPCIDAGDPASPLDPDGTIADIGAFYYNQSNGTENNEVPEISLNLNNFPNPFNPSTTINFDIKENETGILKIFNIKGQKIESHQFEPGNHNYVWDAIDQASGVYLYKLETKSMIKTKKMLFLK
ncbi:MAG: T9SS type A sorting domain-containing protein [Candidatus Cloacimonetes bacterium]|nr:T9SS type A sorting domain-containing protein [Candidatus Cloacimonadota bacterium]